MLDLAQNQQHQNTSYSTSSQSNHFRDERTRQQHSRLVRKLERKHCSTRYLRNMTFNEQPSGCHMEEIVELSGCPREKADGERITDEFDLKLSASVSEVTDESAVIPWTQPMPKIKSKTEYKGQFSKTFTLELLRNKKVSNVKGLIDYSKNKILVRATRLNQTIELSTIFPFDGLNRIINAPYFLYMSPSIVEMLKKYVRDLSPSISFSEPKSITGSSYSYAGRTSSDARQQVNMIHNEEFPKDLISVSLFQTTESITLEHSTIKLNSGTLPIKFEYKIKTKRMLKPTKRVSHRKRLMLCKLKFPNSFDCLEKLKEIQKYQVVLNSTTGKTLHSKAQYNIRAPRRRNWKRRRRKYICANYPLSHYNIYVLLGKHLDDVTVK